MSLLDAYEEGTLQTAKAMDAAPLPEPVPEPKHSAWTVVPRFLAGAALEVAGNLVDVGSMIGQVAEGETRDYGDFEPLNTRPEASRPHYEMAREMRPDPLTAGLAENVIFGVGKGLTKAGAAVAAGGPILGAAAFGLSEGMTTSEDLAEQGVDAETRQKVGAVTGVVSGASVMLPVAGTSLLKTAGLVAAGGPAAYIAQETIIKDILEEADYQKIADQHDPLDPVGLAVSTLLPAAFGAMAMRGAFKGKATQEELDAAMVHNTTIKADQFEAETPQAVEAMKQAEESVKDIRATYEHTGDIGKVITEKLMDIGNTPQEAADKGLLWDSFFKSMESRTGQDASQLFGKYYDRVFNAGEALPEDAIMQQGGKTEPVFFSQLSRSMEQAPAKVFGTGKQLKQWLTANHGNLGVKKDEIEATGLNDWLDLQGKVSKEQVQEFLANNGVKVEEVTLGGMAGDVAKRQIFEKWAPLIEEQQRLMDDTGTGKDEQRRSALLEYERLVDAREKEVAEAGGNATETKFNRSDLLLPGGENYRELLLTLPARNSGKYEVRNSGDNAYPFLVWNKETDKQASRHKTQDEAQQFADSGNTEVNQQNFKSSHFDQPNILAHVRFNERTDADGKRVLFLEEIQSDFGQSFRKQKEQISKAVDADFTGIVDRMKKAGILTVECD